MEHYLEIDGAGLLFGVSEDSRLGRAFAAFARTRDELADVFESRVEVLQEKHDEAEAALDAIDWNTTPEEALELWQEWMSYNVLVGKLRERASVDVDRLIETENLSERVLTITPGNRRPPEISRAIVEAAKARKRITDVETGLKAHLRDLYGWVAGVGIQGMSNPKERAWQANNKVGEIANIIGDESARDVAESYLDARGLSLPERPTGL